LGRPFVYGSIYRFEGQVSVFCQPGGPCYRCLFPEENAVVANCAEAGVVGVLAGVIGSIQATEALKLLLGIGESSWAPFAHDAWLLIVLKLAEL
jgi:adenylyltransferase/sulfurtransferase